MGEIGMKPIGWISPAGVHVVYQEVAKADELCASIFIRVGQLHDPAGKPGLAHMVEHLVMAGMANLDGKSLYEAYSLDRGIAYPTGQTGFNETLYKFRIDGEERELIFKSFLREIFAIFQNPVFLPDALRIEKDRLCHELMLRRETPAYFLHDALKFLSPYDMHDQKEDLDVLFDITERDVLDFISAHYAPQNIILSIAGDEFDFKSVFMHEEQVGAPLEQTPFKSLPDIPHQRHFDASGYSARHFLYIYKTTQYWSPQHMLARTLTYMNTAPTFARTRDYEALYIMPEKYLMEGACSSWLMISGSQPTHKIYNYENKMTDTLSALCNYHTLRNAKEALLFFKGNYVSSDYVAECLGEHYLRTNEVLDYDDYSDKIEKIDVEGFKYWVEKTFQSPQIILTA